MEYLKGFVDEMIPDNRVVGLKTRDAAADAAANYTDEIGGLKDSGDQVHWRTRSRRTWKIRQVLTHAGGSGD